MNETGFPPRPRRLASLVGWRRVGVTLGISIASGLILSTHRIPPWTHWAPRAAWVVTCSITLGLGGMLVFGLFERWPRSLPRWLERWVLQVLGVAITMPIVSAAFHRLTDPPGAPPFDDVPARVVSFWLLTVLGLLVAPWTALASAEAAKST